MEVKVPLYPPARTVLLLCSPRRWFRSQIQQQYQTGGSIKYAIEDPEHGSE